ncbi:hypothetical protein BHAOGJBA_4505 [Methylobacterium hispanicum]|uniref:HTH HARE-type domain-containing protein n=1 Tax=Methylobacterium hispanicum TaxID=270350 RepID=A0AAV4ZSB0_9HYPH|nr:hypothetical protein [Methylobacterium hispanicum]GJD90961.1 hypothetical protein BHAOGJBA_4505 [Methylobacterium hispanicum]
MLNHGTGGETVGSFPSTSAAERPDRPAEHGRRPAKAPPSVEDSTPPKVFPRGFKTFTTDMVLETLRKSGPSTRIEMFETVFGPDNLGACDNPSSYLHKAIRALMPGRVAECGYRNGSKIYQLTDQAPPPAGGLFSPPPAVLAEGESVNGTALPPQDADGSLPRAGAATLLPVPADDIIRRGSRSPVDAPLREEARRFVEISVAGAFLFIRCSDAAEAETLVAGIFAAPTAPLPDGALVAGWRADLAAMAFASSPERRAVRFAGLDVARAEAAFTRIVTDYELGIGEHATAMRVVIDALSGASMPCSSDKAWVEDAFGALRMQIPKAVAAPGPPPDQRLDADQGAGVFTPKCPSEALKSLALRAYRADSPAGQIMGRYAPLVRALFDGGHSSPEIARTFIDEGMRIPVDMAIALVERIRTRAD